MALRAPAVARLLPGPTMELWSVAFQIETLPLEHHDSELFGAQLEETVKQLILRFIVYRSFNDIKNGHEKTCMHGTKIYVRM